MQHSVVVQARVKNNDKMKISLHFVSWNFIHPITSLLIYILLKTWCFRFRSFIHLFVYLYKGFPALSRNHNTIYTRSSLASGPGSISQGSVAVRPRTASTDTVETATKKDENKGKDLIKWNWILIAQFASINQSNKVFFPPSPCISSDFNFPKWEFKHLHFF